MSELPPEPPDDGEGESSESKNRPKAPNSGDTPEGQAEPTDAQKQAAQEWVDRQSKSVDEERGRERARLEIEEIKRNQEYLEQVHRQEMDIADAIETIKKKKVLDEEEANRLKLLEQLRKELNSVQSMRIRKENRAYMVRQETRDIFRRLVEAGYRGGPAKIIERDENYDPKQPVTPQDMTDLQVLVDDIRKEQGLAPKYGEALKGHGDGPKDLEEPDQPEAPANKESKDKNDRHQRMRDEAADNI